MGRISLQSRSVGDTITAADLNADLQEFVAESRNVQGLNFRAQGLDIHNFRRGVLSHNAHYSQHVSCQLYHNSTREFGHGLNTERVFIGGSAFNTQGLGENIDFEAYQYVLRVSFNVFLNWHESGDITTFSTGTGGYLNLDTLVFLHGTRYAVTFNEEFFGPTEKPIVLIHGDNKMVESRALNETVTFTSVIDPSKIPRMVTEGWTYLHEMSLDVVLEMSVSQNIKNPLKVKLQVSSGLFYITKFRK